MTDLLTDDWLTAMRERDARLQAVLAEAIATATTTRDALDIALFTLDSAPVLPPVATPPGRAESSTFSPEAA
ncbi:MAG TPA: hypothetical protein VN731_10280 [Rhodanobacter sp.]|nr:hypothetical protein [Rhodanobacter sp.]